MPALAENTILRRDSARHLVSDDQFAGVVATVLDNNDGMTAEVAEKITDEALKFVAGAARFPGHGMRPSRVVDEGWHALILHTKVYAELCEKLGGFIHHVPERPDTTRHHPGAMAKTQEFISLAGYVPVSELWERMEKSGITVSASCSHSPPSPEGSCTESCAPSGPN